MVRLKLLYFILCALFVTGVVRADEPQDEPAAVDEPAAAVGEPQDEPVAAVLVEPLWRIDLITMGPGDHLFTRGGHASLLVMHTDETGAQSGRVFNYGATDWDQSNIALKFMLGTLQFRLEEGGTLAATIAEYGTLGDRSIYRQTLNLSQQQAQRVAQILEAELAPDKRDYPYHHVENICTTRIRDLLNEVLDGELERQLGPTTLDYTVRDSQQAAFEGNFWASIGADLFFGRRHDELVSSYYALYSPDHMREVFPTVMIPTGEEGATRPLATASTVVRGRIRPHPITGVNDETWKATLFAGAVLVIGLLLGIRQLRQGRFPTVVICGCLGTSAVLGTVMVGLALFSSVAEVRVNEWLILFSPLDAILLVLILKRQFTKPSRHVPLEWLVYSWARVGVLAIGALFWGIGLLKQEPVLVGVTAVLGICTCHALLLLAKSMSRKAPNMPTKVDY